MVVYRDSISEQLVSRSNALSVTVTDTVTVTVSPFRLFVVVLGPNIVASSAAEWLGYLTFSRNL